jgi:hypothetical protein
MHLGGADGGGGKGLLLLWGYSVITYIHCTAVGGWQGVGKPSKGRQGRAGVGGGHTNSTNGTPAGQQKRETKGGSREVCEGERVVDVFG